MTITNAQPALFRRHNSVIGKAHKYASSMKMHLTIIAFNNLIGPRLEFGPIPVPINGFQLISIQYN